MFCASGVSTGSAFITADLADVAAKHDVNSHSFADDTQLYVHCRRGDISTAVDRLEECITEVGQWMSANRLKLNADKTELLWAGAKHGLAYFGSNRPSLRLGADTVTASEHVRDDVVRPQSGEAR